MLPFTTTPSLVLRLYLHSHSQRFPMAGNQTQALKPVQVLYLLKNLHLPITVTFSLEGSACKLWICESVCNICSLTLWTINYVSDYVPGPILNWKHSVALTKRACLRSQFMVLKATPTEQLSWDPMSLTYLQTHTLYVFQAVWLVQTE